MHLAPDTDTCPAKNVPSLKKFRTGNEPMDIIFETHKMEIFL